MLNKKIIAKLKKIYIESKTAKIGSEIICPTCKKKHIKTTYQKLFCGNKKCKDWYWNNIIESRASKKNAYYYSKIIHHTNNIDDEYDDFNRGDEDILTDFDNQYN